MDPIRWFGVAWIAGAILFFLELTRLFFRRIKEQ